MAKRKFKIYMICNLDGTPTTVSAAEGPCPFGFMDRNVAEQVADPINNIVVGYVPDKVYGKRSKVR